MADKVEGNRQIRKNLQDSDLLVWDQTHKKFQASELEVS